MKVFDKVFLKVQDKVASKDLNYKQGVVTVVSDDYDHYTDEDHYTNLDHYED